MAHSNTKSKTSEPDTQANQVLKTQIDVSIDAARSLIHSWLPPPKPGEKMDDDQDQEILFEKFSTGRPDRLGLGAKYLSHNEAMKLNTTTGGATSKQQIQLKNKILNQNQRAASKRNHGNNESPNSANKRSRTYAEDDDDSDDNDRKATTSKKKKTIGGQGDFLSMYLNERSSKKKNKAKK
ncbi:uncharacterized protein BX664DRAFT_31083 [Halteromyces radiatus]|uniref:uncharacterized protein n=1 Tax=Halteromyces radiatus TaxID=101107 RepID=UPI00221F19D0|nr:uncharacterized protein BX664DRAFT_31083 [Halteromyces radiatus]KAI8099967.1 hypothetical protein BX664DRAFT_31083 [Halteromyces radiatus]